MLRICTLVLAVTAAALSLTAAADAGSTALPKLVGTVGPGFTITLKRFNKPVKTLKAGRYVIVVSDKSNIHDFHLSGPGRVNRIITGVGFVGTKTVIVRLVKGTYRFVCDPHLTTMKGSFRVI